MCSGKKLNIELVGSIKKKNLGGKPRSSREKPSGKTLLLGEKTAGKTQRNGPAQREKKAGIKYTHTYVYIYTHVSISSHETNTHICMVYI